MDKLIIIWKFDKKENFWFLIPVDKKLIKSDFFVTLRNSNNAKNWDLVEAMEIINKKWKSREAKILKILEEKVEIKGEKQLDGDLIEWIYSRWKWDFWFIDVEWISKWFFVFWMNKTWALDWDKVRAIIKIFNWKKEAVVLKVLERKLDLIVWEYRDNGNFWFVVPRDKLVWSDIFVAWKNSLNAKSFDIVWVLVTSWIWKNPEWIIKEIIWKKWEKNIDLLSIIVEWWARLKFPENVLEYVNKIEKSFISPSYRAEEKGIRKDLSNLFTFTIDWEDAKDLDDAISIEKIGDNYKLYVHIADVSNYIVEKSDLDIEAFKRATSIYLVDRVIPMLPEVLSNDLCSLNPNTIKLTLTCEMFLNTKWEIIDQKVYESIINSDFRLTYSDVDKILNSELKIDDKLFFWQQIISVLLEKINLSWELKDKISIFKKNKWVLDFDFLETKIILNNNDEIIDIVNYPRYESNKIIEEFMISANESVSKHFSKLPFLYRIHEEPKTEDLLLLQERLNLFELDFKFKKGDTKEFQILLEKISKLEESKKMFLEKMVLRTLSKAIYSKVNLGHFGLWLNFYSHFTSPIRRYPDLQIHRIIKEKISWKLDNKRLIHYENILEKVSKHTSDKERKAEKLEYKVKDYFIVKYYKDKIWEEFDWIIMWVIPKWFFVWLSNTAEWFVEMTSSDFNDLLWQHTDFKTWKTHRLWDKIRVKLIEVDENLLRLNFEII